MYTQLEQRGMAQPPVNVSTLRDMKAKGEPIACLTAYDASYAALVDAGGTDLVVDEEAGAEAGDGVAVVAEGRLVGIERDGADIGGGDEAEAVGGGVEAVAVERAVPDREEDIAVGRGEIGSLHTVPVGRDTAE